MTENDHNPRVQPPQKDDESLREYGRQLAMDSLLEHVLGRPGARRCSVPAARRGRLILWRLLVPAAAAAAVVVSVSGFNEWQAKHATEAASAKVAGISGKVEFRRAEHAHAVAAGEVIRPGDGLALGADGQVTLSYPDGSVVQLERNTKVVLGAGQGTRWLGLLSIQAGGKQIALDAGRLTAEVTKQKSRQGMTLLTPNAGVKVVGTKFGLGVAGGETVLAVQEGLITMNQATQCLDVRAGKLVVANASGLEAVRTEDRPRDLTPVTVLETPVHLPVELVQDGVAQAVIYVADSSCRASLHPAGNAPLPSRTDLTRLVIELVETIRLSTGVTLELVDAPPSANQTAIIIGDCEESRQAGIDASTLPTEGFVVKTAHNRVYLVGSTRQKPTAATAWAVADFLERLVGVRWYWAAEYGGRSIPARRRLSILPAYYRDQPVFPVRQAAAGYGNMNRENMARIERANETEQWRLFMELDRVLDAGTHLALQPQLPLLRAGGSSPYHLEAQQALHARLASAAPRNVEAMFALQADGSRNFDVLCFSAPETFDFLIKGCEQVWDKGGSGLPGITSTSLNLHLPNTIGLACHCKACNATAARLRDDHAELARLGADQGERLAGEIVEGRVHGLVVGLFLKRLCEVVKQRWPDKKVIYWPWGADCPEGVSYPDNLVVNLLEFDEMMALMSQPEACSQQESRLCAWNAGVTPPGGKPRGGSAVRCITWHQIGSFNDALRGPVQYPHALQMFYQRNQDMMAGVRLEAGSQSSWTTAAPTFYVWMRVLWNPELDVDAVLDEMCRRLFGPGAATARDLLRQECAQWEGMSRLPRSAIFQKIWPREAVVRMTALRNKALSEMAGDPNARLAFLHWTREFDEFLRTAAVAHQDHELAAGALLDRAGNR